MEIGDLVLICPGDATIGVYLGADPSHSSLERTVDLNHREMESLHRSMVLFDADVYTVPTFQLEIVNESR